MPDEFINKIIKRRISKLDCKINGFILDGYPGSKGQIQFLKDIGLSPSHLIILEIPDFKIYERIENRRFDPVTGKFFNIAVESIKTKEVVERLVHNPEDHHPIVKKRLERFKAFITEIEEEYPRLVTRVNADATIQNVFQNICECVEKS